MAPSNRCCFKDPAHVVHHNGWANDLKDYPLVSAKEFVQSTRDTGYRSTAAAIAELVDNAVQAEANTISLTITQDEMGIAEISVRDDGHGMTWSQVQRALQWGGSSRFNDRRGFGRFGMGLPNSSVSQARRVEVYTWQKRDHVHYCYFDLDEISEAKMVSVPRPRRLRLPRDFPHSGPHGTIVIWRKCDRLDCQRASTLRRRLALELGRIFRHIIAHGVVIKLDGEIIAPNDPMFLATQDDSSRGIVYGEPIIYDIALPGAAGSTRVTVLFSQLPVAKLWSLTAGEKRKRGIVGGGGVYVIRAGREIAHGWYFMGSKKRQNYDDWWRCEVSFEPALDEWMGVTHSKQGIRPRPELSAILNGDIAEAARELSGQIRAHFTKLKCRDDSAALASRRDWRIPRAAVETGGIKRSAHLTYSLDIEGWPERRFMGWRVDGNVIRLTLNSNHAFYRRIFRHGSDLNGSRNDVELMLFAFARAQVQHPINGVQMIEFWGDVLATFFE